MIELNDLFDYGLRIYQNKSYFKFSLDSILLGEFVKLKNNDEVLDLCTGNAPIPLIMVTRNPKVHIDAVEIQKEVFDLADKSIKENHLEEKINLHLADAKSINFKKKYDSVVCNPPYFKIDNTSQKNQNEVKKIARHEITMTLEDVVRIAKDSLKENGSLFMVHRVERFLDTIELLKQYKFGIRKTIFVTTKKKKNAEFFLIEASKYKKSDLKVRAICVEGLQTYKNIFKED